MTIPPRHADGRAAGGDGALFLALPAVVRLVERLRAPEHLSAEPLMAGFRLALLDVW